MADIKGNLVELHHIEKEIQRLTKELKTFRSRKKELEETILSFIKDTKQPGIKYKGIAIVPKTKNKRRYKKKSEKEKDGAYVLEKYGIQNSDKILKELVEAMKGEEEFVEKLKVSRIRN